MLARMPLTDLQSRLSSALSLADVGCRDFGTPQLVEVVCRDSEKLFQGYSKAKANKQDAYAAALAFMRGQKLDLTQTDQIASALMEPMREQAGARVIGSAQLATLLEGYEAESRTGDLWRLTWYALLSSYFAFDIQSTNTSELDGFKKLRCMLERTWPMIDRQTGDANVPDWISALRQERNLLTANPTDRYAREFLDGNNVAVTRLASDLGITQASWFWHSLVLSAASTAIALSDPAFKKLLPRLIELIEDKPGYKDEVVELILNRYFACSLAPLDETLKNYVVRKDIWRNPKLKSAGIATAWNRVPDPVWKMVLAWVNERNLVDFFDILASRNKADEGRLAFWSTYMKQISWTRLVFGAETIALKNSNSEIRDLIAREEGSYATLTSNQGVDAFMMGIGNFIIVEFSKKPNAAYVYRASSTKFNRNSAQYSGGTDDLKYGYYDKNELRVTHQPGWQFDAAEGLKQLGIFPDPAGAQREVTPLKARAGVVSPVRRWSATDSPADANFTLKELTFLVGRYENAYIVNNVKNGSGALWVKDPDQRQELEDDLKRYGFKWAAGSDAWYFPER